MKKYFPLFMFALLMATTVGCEQVPRLPGENRNTFVVRLECREGEMMVCSRKMGYACAAYKKCPEKIEIALPGTK